MLDHEVLLEYATEDAGALNRAVETLEEEGPENAGDALLPAFSAFARTRDALPLIRTELSDDPEFRPYIAPLRKLCGRGEKRLSALIQSEGQAIDRAFREQGELRAGVSGAEVLLNRFCAGMEDHELFSDDPEPPPDLLDPGADFLLIFSDLYRVASLTASVMAPVPSFGRWRDSVFRLEGLFKDRFGYFEALADRLTQMADREYKLDVWWLRNTPRREDLPYQELSDEQVQRLFQGRYAAGHTPCPAAEQVVSYALGESFLEERQQVLRHLVHCPTCLRLVVDVQAAQQEAHEAGNDFSPLPANIEAALAMPVAYPRYADFYDRIKQIAPSMVIPPEGRLADIPAHLLTAHWPALQPFHPAEAKTLHPQGLVVHLHEGRIQNIHPVSAVIRHEEKMGEVINVRGIVKVDSPLPVTARLMVAMFLDDSSLLWPRPAPRWIPETGEFELKFPLKDRPAGELRFMVLVTTDPRKPYGNQNQ